MLLVLSPLFVCLNLRLQIVVRSVINQILFFFVPHRAQLESSNKNSKLALSGTVDYNSELSSSETNVPPRDQTPTWGLP